MKNKIIVWTLRLLALAIFCVALVFFYAWKIEPNFLTITRQEIVLEKATGTTKIVVLSDFHFSKKDRSRAEEIIKKTLALNPDAICMLGDYTNLHSKKRTLSLEAIAEVLGAFPRAGVPTFAVMGNHDGYAGRQVFDKLFSNQGIRVFVEKDSQLIRLKNGKEFLFAGTLDAHSFAAIFDKNCVPINTTNAPCILLSHSPGVVPFLNKTIDLALCGHTHGGQIRIPFWGPLAACSKYCYGLNKTPAGAQIFTTRGLGQSVLPLRFCCPPEILELTIRGNKKSPQP